MSCSFRGEGGRRCRLAAGHEPLNDLGAGGDGHGHMTLDFDRHYRDLTEPCDGCGARWIAGLDDGHYIEHAGDCPVHIYWQHVAESLAAPELLVVLVDAGPDPRMN